MAAETVVHSVQTSEKEGASETHHQESTDGIRVEVLQGSMALDLARRTHPPNPWSPQMRKLYAFLTVAYLCSALNGKREILCCLMDYEYLTLFRI
jgi:hypothetical protein